MQIQYMVKFLFPQGLNEIGPGVRKYMDVGNIGVLLHQRSKRRLCEKMNLSFGVSRGKTSDDRAGEDDVPDRAKPNNQKFLHNSKVGLSLCPLIEIALGSCCDPPL